MFPYIYKAWTLKLPWSGFGDFNAAGDHEWYFTDSGSENQLGT